MTTRLLSIIFLFCGLSVFAGNPDRQGESGAGELLLNPWARSAGFHSMNTSFIGGVEAMRINVAGLGNIGSNREIVVSNTRLYEGSTLQVNGLGYAQKSKNGKSAFGISMTNVNFGDIEITTEDLPEGTGGTYAPGFFNLGLGYAYTYENKISVGFLIRAINESITGLNAFGMAVDAGVQYVSGENDEFKLGISLRNVGTPMSFGGNGLNRILNSGGVGNDYPLLVANTAKTFELPSLLHIGLYYDIYFNKMDDGEGNMKVDRGLYMTILGNFTSNAFSRDQIGIGAQVSIRDKIMLRAAYKYEIGGNDIGGTNLYSGLAGGATLLFKPSKTAKTTMGIDYAYRATHTFKGTHNFSIRLLF